jgi:7-carboxy-7-deazaguanine synthase
MLNIESVYLCQISSMTESTPQISSQVLPLMEAFYTLQGEGAYAGHAAYFIRLAGCDVGCVWCDVKESWNAESHPKVSVEKIVKEASKHESRLAVITGGEPLMYDLNELTKSLQNAGFKTNIETSGAHNLSGKWNWVCLSPKKFKEPLPEILLACHELKIIVYNQSDFKFAEKYAALVSEKCKLFLQVEWSKKDSLLPKVIDYVKKHPKWSLSTQTHKYLDIP